MQVFLSDVFFISEQLWMFIFPKQLNAAAVSVGHICLHWL
jgi:hypothetical protein